jgi:hypothetical protein
VALLRLTYFPDTRDQEELKERHWQEHIDLFLPVPRLEDFRVATRLPAVQVAATELTSLLQNMIPGAEKDPGTMEIVVEKDERPEHITYRIHAALGESEEDIDDSYDQGDHVTLPLPNGDMVCDAWKVTLGWTIQNISAVWGPETAAGEPHFSGWDLLLERVG